MDKGQIGLTTLGYELIDTFDVAADGLSADVHFKEAYAGWLGTIGGDGPAARALHEEHPDQGRAGQELPADGRHRQGARRAARSSTSPPAPTRSSSPGTTTGRPATTAPYLDAVTYKFYPDNKEGMIAAFLAGEIDVALDLVQADYDAIKGVDPSIGKALLEPAWLYEHLDMNQAGLGQGKGHPALKDLVVRQAIAQAIDKKALFATVFPGSPLPGQGRLHQRAPRRTTGSFPTRRARPFDVAAANAALDAAGYTTGADGIRVDKSGNPLVFEHCTSTAGFRQLGGDFLAKSLQAIGIKLNLNFVDSTTILFAGWADVKADTKCNLAHGNYDTSEFAYVLTFDLFGDYYYSYATEQIPTDANKGNGYNYLRLSNPDMDAAIERS